MSTTPSANDIAIDIRPPNMEELIIHYPSKMNWTHLKALVNSGDLGLLKRHQKLQERYDKWMELIKANYCTLQNYLMTSRLQWGKPDHLSLLPSALKAEDWHHTPGPLGEVPKYFTSDISPQFLSIIQNDWPYSSQRFSPLQSSSIRPFLPISVPLDVEHTIIWTRAPVIHEDLIPAAIFDRVEHDGLWGFTGLLSLPPSPLALPSSLPVFSESDIPRDKVNRSDVSLAGQKKIIPRAAKEVQGFVKRRWNEQQWETAWFVNPLRLQSVPGISHIHVFARRKS